MDADALVEIGLSKNEALVYLALVELGCSVIGDVAKRSKVHRTNVYDAVERLKKRGLACTVQREGKQMYEAADPAKLVDHLKEKEVKLLDLMPKLKLNYHMVQAPTQAAIYEGVAANRRLLEGLLKFDDDITSYGLPKGNPEITGLWWINNYHKRRIAKKQRMIHIYNENAKERIKYLNSLPYTEAKYLPKEYNSPVSVEICGDQVLITSWHDPLTSILITNKEIAKTFRSYFTILYQVAKVD